MTAVWLAGNGRLTKLKENVAVCSCMNKGRTAHAMFKAGRLDFQKLGIELSPF